MASKEKEKALLEQFRKDANVHEDRLRNLHQEIFHYSTTPPDFQEFCIWLSNITIQKYDAVGQTKRRIEALEEKIFETEVKKIARNRKNKESKHYKSQTLEVIYGEDIEAGNVFLYEPESGYKNTAVVSRCDIYLYQYFPKDYTLGADIESVNVDVNAAFDAIRKRSEVDFVELSNKKRRKLFHAQDKKVCLKEKACVKALKLKTQMGCRIVKECHEICRNLDVSDSIQRDFEKFNSQVCAEIKTRQNDCTIKHKKIEVSTIIETLFSMMRVVTFTTFF